MQNKNIALRKQEWHGRCDAAVLAATTQRRGFAILLLGAEEIEPHGDILSNGMHTVISVGIQDMKKQSRTVPVWKTWMGKGVIRERCPTWIQLDSIGFIWIQ